MSSVSSSSQTADSTNQRHDIAQQFLTGFHDAEVSVEESAGEFGTEAHSREEVGRDLVEEGVI